jgi:hypothetical protein
MGEERTGHCVGHSRPFSAEADNCYSHTSSSPPCLLCDGLSFTFARKLFQNEARSSWLQKKTRASQEHYIERRKESNALIKQKKRTWLNNKILQIEENHKRNETKKFFN